MIHANSFIEALRMYVLYWWGMTGNDSQDFGIAESDDGKTGYLYPYGKKLGYMYHVNPYSSEVTVKRFRCNKKWLRNQSHFTVMSSK